MVRSKEALRMRGTRTEENLLKAFAGESQARNRYSFFAKIARKEGYEEIAAIFEQTAEHELSHSKNFFKYLDSQEAVEIKVAYPGGRLGTTIENLQESINNEFEEWSNLYKSYGDIAGQEGFSKVEALFKAIAKVEAFHEERFKEVLTRLENGSWFKREVSVKWMCRKCGYIHIGTEAPKVCPACMHPQGYFEVYASHL